MTSTTDLSEPQRTPAGYQPGASQTIAGLEAFVIGEVLRIHLSQHLERWAAHLDPGAVARIRWVAAGIVKAGRAWAESGAHTGPASDTSLATAVSMVRQSRPELLTTVEAAEALDMTPEGVRKLAQRGVIGQKVGRDHVFTQAELDSYSSQRSGRRNDGTNNNEA